jgi:uncharacterized protein (TIGR02118 family)
MSVTLLAQFRRPDGGDDALHVFLDRYEQEHLPLIAAVPGLRSMTIHRVVQSFTPESDLILTNQMVFDDRDALDVAMASEPMRQAGRNLRDIAPGLLTLVALEEAGPSEWPVGDPDAA